MPRITPVEPPYEPDTASMLESMMPPGVPPIGLFRTWARNLPMADALRGWGGYALSRNLSLSLRERELVIDRVCARCGCEYEWGVHIAFFADRAQLTPAQITSLTHGDPVDECWSPSERALLSAVDQLHESATITDDLWSALATHFTDEQLLDLMMVSGWYHAVSYAANGARIDLEPGAPRFTDVLSEAG